MKSNQFLLTSALLCLSAFNAQADSHQAKDKNETVMCHGVNSCKGQGSCAGKVDACSGKDGCNAEVSCAGKNSCKGKGLLKMTKADCLKKVEKLQVNKLYGIGLRHAHFNDILKRLEEESSSLSLDYFEIITENFFQTEGRPLKILEKIRSLFPISFHGVSLSLAEDAPLDFEYLNKIKKLEQRINPFLISDHLCFTGTKNQNLHNLLPFPYTQEKLHEVSQKVLQVQDFLKRPLLIENLSAYMNFGTSQMTEAEFLNELHKKTDCHILLGINNMYVNYKNFNIDMKTFLNQLPLNAIKEIHLAGFSDMGDFLFDTHSNPIHTEVLEFYQNFISRHTQDIAITVEWDEDIPPLDRLLEESRRTRL